MCRNWQQSAEFFQRASETTACFAVHLKESGRLGLPFAQAINTPLLLATWFLAPGQAVDAGSASGKHMQGAAQLVRDASALYYTLAYARMYTLCSFCCLPEQFASHCPQLFLQASWLELLAAHALSEHCGKDKVMVREYAFLNASVSMNIFRS
jgi:hypothetical protein